jgi:hypothetical protein
MNLYTKDNIIYNPSKGIEHDGFIIFNANEADILEWGYEKYVPTLPPTNVTLSKDERIDILKQQLQKTDYIPLKAIEGYDCDTIYPGWKEERKTIRDEINRIEEMTDEEYMHEFDNIPQPEE